MKSMTGFGKSTFTNENYQIEVELKSVNNRYLDLQFRMPREYNEYEMILRQILKESIGRGRIECAINVKNEHGHSKELAVNWYLLDSLVEQMEKAKKTRYQSCALDIDQMVAGLTAHQDFFEIVENKEVDPHLEHYFVEAIKRAIEKLNSSREHEGAGIKIVMEEYLKDFTTYVLAIKEMSEIFELDYQTKLETKLQNLVEGNVEESRVLTEVAILIERGDIHEELDRLTIHINKMKDLLGEKEAIGRELDFLIQEMNREVNTIGSKSTPIDIKNAVVQMKTILEKIREQVQNVE